MDNCGIDLHLKSSEVCVVDEVGEIAERAQIPTTERSFVRWFGNRKDGYQVSPSHLVEVDVPCPF